MTRDEARKAAEVMLAYADGKDIEYATFSGWKPFVNKEPIFDWYNGVYRIKPETKDSTFKNDEERYKEIKAIDWEQRRYDIVKDLVVQFCHNDMNFVSEPFCSEDLARIDMAVHYADAIIEELKKKRKPLNNE